MCTTAISRPERPVTRFVPERGRSGADGAPRGGSGAPAIELRVQPSADLSHKSEGVVRVPEVPQRVQFARESAPSRPPGTTGIYHTARSLLDDPHRRQMLTALGTTGKRTQDRSALRPGEFVPVHTRAIDHDR